jgi:ADP-ribosylglycohydrolase
MSGNVSGHIGQTRSVLGGADVDIAAVRLHTSKMIGMHDERLARALLSLDGLSVGDAFGQNFFVRNPEEAIAERRLSAPPWYYTDDTEMGLAVVEMLASRGSIDSDGLAAAFAQRYLARPNRGYGGTAHEILREIGSGVPWQTAARSAFSGSGSMGNGAAMRIAPLGAYFADDLGRVASEAIRSAEVTHAHPDGIAGAVAVAIAAAIASSLRESASNDWGTALLRAAFDRTPPGETRSGIARALDIPLDYSVETAVSALGNGSRVISCDTVPLALWCAARHLSSFEEALWTTVSALGDRDTTCAIVGGIVSLAVGRAGLPPQWLQAREPLELRLPVG